MKSRAFWAFLDQMSLSASNFIVSVLLARALGVADFAQYVLAYTAILFLAALHRALVTQPLNTLGVGDAAPALRQRYHALLWITAGFALALALIALAVVPVIAPVAPGRVACAAVFAFAFLIQEVVRRLQYTVGTVARAFWLGAVAYWLPALALGGLALAGVPLSVERAFGIMAAAMAASFLVGHFWAGPGPARFRGRRLRLVLREHWCASRWLLATQFVFFAGPQIYPFFLAGRGDPLAVATYSACLTLLNVFNVLRVTIGNALPSPAANLYAARGVPGLRRLLVSAVAAGGALTLGAGVVIFLLADLISAELYGGRFPELPAVLAALVFAQVFSVISSILDVGGLVAGRTRSVFVAYAVAGAVSLTLGQWLIAAYGLWGAVWATGLSLFLPAAVQGTALALLLRA